MKKLRILSIITALSIIQIAILNGQNSIASQMNKSSNILPAIKYINITNISYGIGIGKGLRGSSGHSSFGIHTINGCLLNSKLSLGLGLGLDRLHIAGSLGQTILPVSLDIRYYFLKDPKILFCGIEGGYTYNLSGNKLGYDSGLGGYFIDPSIGAKVFILNKTSLVMSLGIKIQENTIKYVWTPLPKNEVFINLKVGLIF